MFTRDYTPRKNSEFIAWLRNINDNVAASKTVWDIPTMECNSIIN